ncbi:MAG: N-acetylneuraminate synthase family protein [Armatimonadota bacterium]
MIIDNFDLNKDIMFVAEIGNNHEGNYALAEKMIHLAKDAGADAVKFQTFKTEHYVTSKDKDRFNRLKSFELTYEEFEKLSKVARKRDIVFLSTPFDLESVEFLNTIVPAFKISSGDNNFYPLLQKVAQTGKPVILSSGLVDLGKIRASKDFIEDIWKIEGIKQQMAVLHCVSSYPVRDEEANLGAIEALRRELGCMVGYSDHTIGTSAAVHAAVLGARIIEKHFTIDKKYSDFRDHSLSADIKSFADMVKKTKKAVTLIGKREKTVQLSERAAVNSMRRSVAAKCDLPEGSTVSMDNITWVRPGGGIPPGDEALLLGKKLTAPVNAGEHILQDMVAN